MLPERHPQYMDRLPDWQMMLDFFKGSRAVKAARTLYLPPTATMVADGMGNANDIGEKAYSAYLMRSIFPHYIKEAVEKFLGVMFQNEPKITLPKPMEYLLENATPYRESLSAFLRRINAQQLLLGRCGVLVDMPDSEKYGALPYLTLYTAPTILNWDDGRHESVRGDNQTCLRFVVLDETGEVSNPETLAWETQERYRLLQLNDGTYQASVGINSLIVDHEGLLTPNISGRSLDEIPFVFFNDKDNLPDCGDPPLLQLAHLCAAIYRGEADYRQNLYMQSQDTLVITGSIKNTGVSDDMPKSDIRVGAGSVIYLSDGSKAEYVGVSSSGLAEQRLSIEADKALAERLTGSLSSNNSATKESGEALQIRLSEQTAMLRQIAATGANGLQSSLRQIARWMDLPEEEVVVKPNIQFGAINGIGADLLGLQQAKNAGAPISLESIHRTLQDRGLTEMGFDDEIKAIAKEINQQMIPQPIATTTNPDNDKVSKGVNDDN